MNIFVEDRISALTTKDPEKLKVYIDNFDGHSLRAYHYFKDQMPDISKQLDSIKDATTVKKITYSDGSIEYIPIDTCKKVI